MKYVGDLVSSKRVVGLLVAGVLHVLARKGIIVPAGVQEEVVTGLVDILGAAWILATKVIDDYKNSKALPQSKN